MMTACANEYKSMHSVAGDPLCVEKFRPAFSADLYKANVQVNGKTLSGLLLIKAMADSSTRVVFSTETGFKFFDFSFGGQQDFKVYYVMKKLDKKVVVDALRNDFELLLMRWVNGTNPFVAAMDAQWYHGFPKGKKISYYITDSLCNELYRAELASKRKKLVTVQLYNTIGQVPDSMFVQHFNFNFTISLKKLER
ncbi:hypothetical protein [Flavihumibacter fluvii]|uniref:hypothetical protein n=1 Tax=Flavihumibacter fluvii TaxID=2838157 RepID=UPI001BDE448E|nr:hypothetical protein [Flavihumibacter fluvii]ULQ51467.1 hypothetical protein KJS93_15370 [Flavihumibacter fluvii]